MKTLTNLLKPCRIGYQNSETLGEMVFHYSSDTAISQHKLAILGYDQEADRLRSLLYTFSCRQSEAGVLDLGNLASPSISSLLSVLEVLVSEDIAVIVLGLPSDGLTPYLKSSSFVFPSHDQLVLHDGYRLLSTLGLDHIHSIAFAAFQRHLLTDTDYAILEDKNIQYLNLGVLKRKIEESEPLIRSVEHLLVDVSCIKFADAPCQKQFGSSGLSSEEICQITHYFGFNPRAKLLMIFGFEAAEKEALSTYAQMIWYFITAYMTNAELQNREDWIHYVVESDQLRHTLEFLLDQSSGMWWIDVPTSDGATKRHPCSRLDYELALQNIISERILYYLSL